MSVGRDDPQQLHRGGGSGGGQLRPAAPAATAAAATVIAQYQREIFFERELALMGKPRTNVLPSVALKSTHGLGFSG